MTASSPETEAWRKNLLTSANGTPKPLLANAIIALRDCATWTNTLAFDVFANEAMIDAAPPWSIELEWVPRAWTPQDDILATAWLQREGIGITTAVTPQAVEVVARDRSYHPVLDYLDSIEHDGAARLDNWLSTYLGAEPSNYNKHIGRAMMIGAVARICNPGCKVDTVPIFEGAQGVGKSTVIKALFDPFFSDELADLGSKDAAMQTRGVWGIEVSELDAMSRGEVAKIKAFISRTTDRYRPPYGHRIVESPRSCVFWGTTNSDNYLKDETGGRRFWPVKTGKINIEGLREIRDQLWAEAVVLFEAGLPWWITRDEVQRDAEQQQSARYIGDPWDNAVADFVESLVANHGYLETTIHRVLVGGLDLQIKHCGQPEMNRVARILRSIGMVRRQRGTGAAKHWIYCKPVPVQTEARENDNVTPFRVVPTATAPHAKTEPVPPERPAAQAQAPRHQWEPPF